VDAQKTENVLLEGLEEDTDQIHQPDKVGNREKQSMGICQHPQGLLANIPKSYSSENSY
jgi:hypothetical protein